MATSKHTSRRTVWLLSLGIASMWGQAQAEEQSPTQTEALTEAAELAPVSALEHELAAPLEASSEDAVALHFEDEGLEALGQYAPPPPRSYAPRYRYYRPSWRLRVLPPPIFAPGWFGVYFFGNPPPPPAYAPAPAPVPQPEAQAVAPAPVKDFRHVGEYSVSLTAGMYSTTYAMTGETMADPGVRVALRYRNAPSLGAEVGMGSFGSNMRFDEQGTQQRADIPMQVSALLYAFPQAPIQPYLVLGATGNLRTYEYMVQPGVFSDSYSEFRAGVHGGLGLELHVGDTVSFSMDARRVLYTLVDRSVLDQTELSDMQVTGGLNVYF